MTMIKYIILISALSLSGCETLSKLRPELSTQEDINTALDAQFTDIPNSWQSAQTRIGTVKIGWIDQLDDPVLSVLVDEAIAHNRDLQAAAANIEQAYALARQAGVPLKPMVGASSGLSRTMFLDGPTPDSSILNWGVTASWEPDVWGRLKSTEKSVYASAQAAEADYRYSQHSIAAAVAQTYLAAIEAQLQIGVSKKSLQTLSETDRIVDVQYSEGYAMAQDAALSESDLAARRADVAIAEGQYRQALRALELLIGRYPAADVVVADRLPILPPLPASDTPVSLIERRPDIQASALNVAATYFNQDQVKLSRLPTFSLTAAPGSNSSNFIDLLNPEQLFINLAGSVSYLIFEGGLTKYQIAEADASRRAALAAHASTVLKALEEVETSLDQTRVLQLQAEALQSSAKEANRALEIARIRYSEGESDILDTLNIEARVVSAESALVSANRAILNEWVALNLALGGSW